MAYLFLLLLATAFILVLLLIVGVIKDILKPNRRQSGTPQAFRLTPPPAANPAPAQPQPVASAQAVASQAPPPNAPRQQGLAQGEMRMRLPGGGEAVMSQEERRAMGLYF